MKARMHFDTLTYANKLKAAGMEPKLAEVQALALVEALDEGIATKPDISQLKNTVKTELAGLRVELTGVKTELRTEIAALRAELIQWMVGLFVTNITLVGTFIALAQFLNHSH